MNYKEVSLGVHQINDFEFLNSARGPETHCLGYRLKIDLPPLRKPYCSYCGKTSQNTIPITGSSKGKVVEHILTEVYNLSYAGRFRKVESIRWLQCLPCGIVRQPIYWSKELVCVIFKSCWDITRVKPIRSIQRSVMQSVDGYVVLWMRWVIGCEGVFLIDFTFLLRYYGVKTQ